MPGLAIVIGILLFNHVLPSKGNTDPHESKTPTATSCEYRYEIQPAQTALSCNVLTAIVLRCQVSSARSNFSISWHHSSSEPESSNILAATKYIQNSTSTVINAERNYFRNTSILVSELVINEFSEIHNGYYWCSVNSSHDTNAAASNPSVVLHILHQIHCTTNVDDSECGREVHFYSPTPAGRCADQNVSVDIVEAYNCYKRDLSDIATAPTMPSTSGSTNTYSLDSQNVNGSNTQNEQLTTETDTSTHVTKAPSLPLTLGIIIGASMGGLILILFVTVGLLLACMVRMKVYFKNQGRAKHRDDPTAPQSADDTHTYNSTPPSDKRDNANRISTMPLELNVSYECLCPQAITLQANNIDNVYDYIQ